MNNKEYPLYMVKIVVRATKALEHMQGYVLENRISQISFTEYFSLLKTLYNEHFIDLFVNVSESEGLPVSIMEAMATGIPVIATDVGGTAEIVNSDNGFLIPKDFTEEQLKEIIIRFNNLSFVERAKLRENAYLTWNEKFNSEKNYQKFVSDVFDMV